jgi:hypothetical protein
MDWREVGEIIRERGREFVSSYAKWELSSTSDGATLDIPIAWFAEGFLKDRARFTKHKVTPEEYWSRYLTRDWYWSRYANPDSKRSYPLDDFADDDPQNGRPRDEASRQAATVACYFYEAWRCENEKRGLKDHGNRREMKDYAAQAVVEDFFAWLYLTPPHRYSWRATAKDVESFTEIVRNLIDKPKRRRDPGSWNSVDIQATRDGLWLPPKPPLK